MSRCQIPANTTVFTRAQHLPPVHDYLRANPASRIHPMRNACLRAFGSIQLLNRDSSSLLTPLPNLSHTLHACLRY